MLMIIIIINQMSSYNSTSLKLFKKHLKTNLSQSSKYIYKLLKSIDKLETFTGLQLQEKWINYSSILLIESVTPKDTLLR